MILHTDLFL